MNYAVDCPSCGRQSLSEDEYNYQMRKPNSVWKCPNCGGNAWWNDDVYEANFEVPSWCFTFGLGTNLSKHFAIIEAHTEFEARSMYVAMQGSANFAFCYSEDEWIDDNMAEKYQLTPIELPHEVYYK